MRSKTSLAALVGSALALAFTVAIWIRPAVAVDIGPAKFAVCDPLKVAQQSRELKDINKKISDDTAAIEQQVNQRKAEATALQQKAQLLVKTSDDYKKAMADFNSKNLENKIWAQEQQDELQEEQKDLTRSFFDKVEGAIAQVAKQKGVSAVISDYHSDLPDDMSNLDINQVRAALLQRALLYNDGSADITGDVVSAMNAAYGAH